MKRFLLNWWTLTIAVAVLVALLLVWPLPMLIHALRPWWARLFASSTGLGLVMFVFPNEYGVYMHDTSTRWLFTRPRRDLSHGCIRVEHPEDLAEWALSNQPDWSRDRIEEAMEGTESVHVKVTRPIQLVTMYVTAVVMKDGEVHFLPDIYGEDHLPDSSESR